MGININAIQKAVTTGINLYPTTITLLRPNKVSDGYGGYFIDSTNPETTVAEFKAFLNDATSSRNEPSISDGGKKENITSVSMIVLDDGTFEIQIGDLFRLNGKEYRVKYSKNMYNAYWMVDLEVKLNG